MKSIVERAIDTVVLHAVKQKESAIKAMLLRNGISAMGDSVWEVRDALDQCGAELYSKQPSGCIATPEDIIATPEDIILNINGVEVDRITYTTRVKISNNIIRVVGEEG